MADKDRANTPVVEKDANEGTNGMNGSTPATTAEDTNGMNGSNPGATGEDTNGMNGSTPDTTAEDTNEDTNGMNGSNADTTGEDTNEDTNGMNGFTPDTTAEDTNEDTNGMNGSNADTTGEDANEDTNGMNGSTPDTTAEDTDDVTDLTNTAPSEDVSEARRTESLQQQSLILNSAINNGSFEGDSLEPGEGSFDDWRTIGDTSIETKEIGIAPIDGESQALITNGFSDAGGSVEESDLSEFLDLTSGSLDALLEGDATEGSGIKQSFTAQAGDILEFDYRLLTNEATPSATFNDTAFFVLGTSVDNPFENPIDNPVGNPVRNFALELGDTSDPTFSQDNGDDNQPVEGYAEATDAKTIRVAVSEAGTYELGFGIVDLSDSIVDSGILLDDVKLISTGVSPFSSSNPDASGGNQPDGAINEVDFTFGTNGFEPTNGSSNPQQ